MTADPDLAAVLADASRQQRRAADPATSAWVSANAGSGKTRVLTERVARLMLAGADPARILCLTYTRAAAAEMSDRLTAMLGRWALMEEADLREALAVLTGGAAPKGADLAQARRLFAKALETPGGLRIQTIHAFCDAALRRFPLEAGVSPDFAVLDEAAADDLAMQARDRLAEAAEAGADGAFDAAAAHLAEEGMDALIGEILSRRALFRAPPDRARIAASFGLAEADLDDPDPMAGLFDGLDIAALRRAAALLAAGSRNDRWIGAPLCEAFALRDAGAEAEALGAALAKALQVGAGAPRDWAKVPTKSADAAHPWVRPLLIALSERFEPRRARALAIAAARRAEALGRFGAAFLAAYEAEKRRRGALDYDDLIEGARRLLATADAAAWALYKLDGGIDHILVDEAQDTAPAQWETIRALAAETHAGEGEGRARTLFVVGDEKQSIYSFQGADPRRFGAERGFFAARMGGALTEATLRTSFRSAPAILRVVDRTFDAAPEGLSADGLAPMHVAAKRDLAGRVDLWPLVEPVKPDDPPPWDAPLDAPPPTDPKLRLAGLLAGQIARWLREGEPLPGAGRPVAPGDVMVLVRRRDKLAAELVRRLKALGQPVAGADRIKVAEELAVRDLMALARVALTPADDLSLAALLRSPLCGLSEDDLFALAHGREGRLWDALRGARDRHPEAVGLIERAMADADFARPYEFFEAALGAGPGQGRGRARLLARLGVEAEDAIDEFLAQALAYEQGRIPTLEGFLDWLARSEVSIKREFDKTAGEIRVMTVHGAKGLEAPVVILPDSMSAKGGRARAIVAMEAEGGPLPAWSAAEGEAPDALQGAKEAAKALERAESRRLLYVAMTRAQNWLIVCGAGAQGEAETWRSLVEAGMRAAPAVEVAAPVGFPEDARMLRVEDVGVATERPRRAEDAAAPPSRVPNWARRPPPPPPSEPPRRAASALGGDAGAGGSGTVGSGTVGSGTGAEPARLRGEAIHALLEHLPDAPPEMRPALADRLLRARAPWADAAQRAEMTGEAARAMAAPEAAPFFADGALAEIAVALDLAGARIAGRIDRLAVDAKRLRAVDFKTDAAPPDAPEAIPEPYLRQLAAYREALRRLHPGCAVEMSLLYTAGPRLMRAPDALLDAALARLLKLPSGAATG
ncbi:double-strand break repair helicase AddA [Rubrimonas sp.]|uniref:double-strand break repair helicase AddA n=1 Tax=Rubrimonas sp. TaxID=2036015 RepID=UPI002FDF0619